MASTAADPSTLTATEEWVNSLGDLVIPSSSLTETTEKLGSGSYSQSSVVVQYNGTKAVSKTVQTFLFARNEFRKLFITDSLQLSKLRHPSIVQLLGVQIKEAGTPPALVYEYLPLNLQSCLQKYPSIPKSDKYSILSDVSRGLHYLHSRPSPMLHGSLNAKNVLLTASLEAKISDPVHFGAQPTASVDSPYHPPEETPSLCSDLFCFGDLIIHVLLQQYPSQLEGKSEDQDLTEVKRRKKYLTSIPDGHKALKELAEKCLDDNPILRPSASSLTRDIEKIVAVNQPEYENVLDMYHTLEKLTLSKETIESLNRTIQGKEVEIEALKQQMEPLRNDLTAKDECLQAQIQEVDSYKQALQGKEARIRAHESGNRAKEALIKAKDREIAAKKQDVMAKESLLRASQKRIEALEQQVSALRKGVDCPPSPSLPSDAKLASRSVSGSPTHSPAPVPAVEAIKSDSREVIYRKNRGRAGRNIVSDGYAYQDAGLRRAKSMSAKDYDPVLANILARQHQRIEEAESSSVAENQEQKAESTSPEKPKAAPPPVRPKRPRSSSFTSSEIHNLMEKANEV